MKWVTWDSQRWGLMNDHNDGIVALAGPYSYSIFNPHHGEFSYPDHVTTEEQRKAYVTAMVRFAGP